MHYVAHTVLGHMSHFASFYHKKTQLLQTCNSNLSQPVGRPCCHAGRTARDGNERNQRHRIGISSHVRNGARKSECLAHSSPTAWRRLT
jgi:hypothetical protein